MLALLLLRFPPASHALLLINRAALALQEATDQGTAFVFGYLGGGALPFAETAPGASFILAFKVLPLVLVISALSGLLYYWGVLQAVTGPLPGSCGAAWAYPGRSPSARRFMSMSA